MDVVYTIRKGETNEELRHSLRSLQNLPHDRVFIVGHKPRWIKNVIYLQTVQIESKYKNVVNNLRLACSLPELSDDFILMNDDFFVLRKVKELQMFHRGPTAPILERLSGLRSRWMNGMRATQEYLISMGHSNPLNYELHVPMVMNKAKFLGMLSVREAMLPDVEAFQKRTLYGNLYGVGGTEMADCKVVGKGRKFTAEKWTFASSHEGSFRTGFIGEYVRRKFPRRSPYEVSLREMGSPPFVQVFNG